jgi:hypothetical protein
MWGRNSRTKTVPTIKRNIIINNVDKTMEVPTKIMTNRFIALHPVVFRGS